MNLAYLVFFRIAGSSTPLPVSGCFVDIFCHLHLRLFRVGYCDEVHRYIYVGTFVGFLGEVMTHLSSQVNMVD